MSGTASGPYKGLVIESVSGGDEGPQTIRVLDSGRYVPLAKAALHLKANPPADINAEISAVINTGFPMVNSGSTSGVGHAVSMGPTSQLALELRVDGAAARDNLVKALIAGGVERPAPKH